MFTRLVRQNAFASVATLRVVFFFAYPPSSDASWVNSLEGSGSKRNLQRVDWSYKGNWKRREFLISSLWNPPSAHLFFPVILATMDFHFTCVCVCVCQLMVVVVVFWCGTVKLLLPLYVRYYAVLHPTSPESLVRCKSIFTSRKRPKW